MTTVTEHKDRNDIAGKIHNLRDLSDFCQHWPELRPILTADDFFEAGADEDKRALLQWMVVFADRVCTTSDPDLAF